MYSDIISRYKHFRMLAMGVVNYVVSTLFIVCEVSCFNIAYYKIDLSLAGKVCPDESRVFEGVAISIRACAMASEERGSAGIVYVTGTSLCYGCDVISMFKTGKVLQNLSAAEFYRRDPPPPGYFYVAGAIMKFVPDQGFTYDQADSACAPYGQLLRIDTPEKQTAIRNTLLDPANGLSGCTRYWLQGRLADDDVWRFDDGDPAPMSGTYWALNQPNGGGGSKCYVLASWNDFFWNDIPCDQLSCYICEAIGSP